MGKIDKVVSLGREEPSSYLDILARAKTALASGRDVSIAASELKPYPDQPRKYFNPEGIRSLSRSIDASGQATSGLVRDHPDGIGYELIDGERRWRAISLISAERQPLYKAKLIVADDDVVRYLISGIANFNREGHTVLETMETIDRFLKFNIPMKEIAGLLGIGENWAGQIHGLKKLVPEVLELLDEALPKKSQLAVTAAIQISKIKGDHQISLARRVLNRDISLQNLRTEVIAVAKTTGTPIRLRELDSPARWKSIRKNASVVSRKLTALNVLLGGSDMKRYLAVRGVEKEEVHRILVEASETLVRVTAALE